MTTDNTQANDATQADLVRGGISGEFIKACGFYTVECFKSDGSLRWKDTIENLIVNAGLDDILDKYWKGSSYTAAHYVGLLQIAGSPAVAAADTMSSHSGWTEFTGISNSPNVRQTLTLGAVSGQSVDNSASKASFTVAAISPESQSVDGAFVTTDSTLGGTSGTLVSAGLFSGGSKTVGNGDTLNVTYTNSMSSS